MARGNGSSRMTVNQKIEEIREQYEKQIFDLKQIIEISKSLNSTLDYSILIDSILYTCMGQMRVLKAGLFTNKGLDQSELTLHRNYKGFDPDHTLKYIIPESHPMLQQLTHETVCYTMEELREKLPPNTDFEALESLEPELIVPLKTKGHINGIIVLSERISPDPFSDYDKDYLLNISALASIAIHNAYLFEMTTTDMMTKLKMRHYFQNKLIEQQDIVNSEGREMSIIMIDIDHFKRLNDTYGHSCGDYVLKAVAQTIQNSVRQDDIAARYGGEEFVVLLPDSDIEMAAFVAERIRKSVEEEYHLYDGKNISCTVSLGVAQFEAAKDVSPKAFIDRADKALYFSKQSGRNKVSRAH